MVFGSALKFGDFRLRFDSSAYMFQFMRSLFSSFKGSGYGTTVGCLFQTLIDRSALRCMTRFG